MAQKANLGTGKSKVIKTGSAQPSIKTKGVKPFPKVPSTKNGNKRQAPSVTVS
jgi:hypothetical protein